MKLKLTLAVLGLTCITAYSQDWAPIGFAKGVIKVLTPFDGQLFIAGNFTRMDGNECFWYSRWDGSQMTYSTERHAGGGFSSMVIHDGQLYGHGSLSDGLMVWSGQGWTSVFQTFQSGSAMYSDGTHLYVGTHFGRLFRYSKSSGTRLVHEFEDGIASIIEYKGELILAGELDNGPAVISLQDTSSTPIGNGLVGVREIHDMEVYKDELYVCGTFSKSDDVPGTAIVKWNGVEWTSVGGSVTGDSWNGIRDLHVYQNELYAVGDMRTIGGKTTTGAAKWNGDFWVDLYSDDSIGSFPNKIADYDGSLYMGMFDFDTAYVYKGNGKSDITGSDYQMIQSFPTLANDYVMFGRGTNSLNERWDYTVYSSVGITCMTGQLNGERLRVSGLKPGWYSIVLQSNEGERRYSKFHRIN